MDLSKLTDVPSVQAIRRGQGDPEEEYRIVSAGGGALVLEIVANQPARARLEDGEPLIVRALKPDTLYQARGKVVEVRKSGTQFVVRITSDVERIQRRQHFRLIVARDVELKPLAATFAELLKRQTTDLSAGGIRLVIERPVCLGDRFGVSLDLGDGLPPIQCNARVVRVLPLPDGGSSVGLSFENLRESLADRITDVLLQEMRRRP